ncbi:MAG: outer membrane lipoprotein-sorting protein [Chthoniobacterales bacterium]|nr:outer membrane lipoprotein-sorting protein [Chthoniobacterales bacterium]
MKKTLLHEATARPAVRHDKKRGGVKQVVNRQLLLVLGLASLSLGLLAGTPSAEEILSRVRLQQAQQQLDLQGQLRTDGTIIPFRITQTGPVIRYTFANPPEVIQLKLGENGSRLDLVHENSVSKFSASRLDDRISGTAVTYGDLALKFLYWPNAEVLGADTLRSRNCWKLRLYPPDKSAPYAAVLLWVDKESGAIMRMESYDQKGVLTKRFEVVSAQKIEGRWFLKQMRVEEMQPGTGKVQSRTYLEIKKPG